MIKVQKKNGDMFRYQWKNWEGNTQCKEKQNLCLRKPNGKLVYNLITSTEGVQLYNEVRMGIIVTPAAMETEIKKTLRV